MNILIMTYSLLALLLPPALWTPVPQEALASSQLDVSVIEGSNNYLKAVLAGDVPRIVSMYREDAIVMPQGSTSLRGKAAIEQFYRGMCGGPAKITAFTFDHFEARVTGDSAYDVGTYKMTMAAGPGRSMTDVGKYNVILKRAGSDWKIAYLIFNSDLPPHSQTASK